MDGVWGGISKADIFKSKLEPEELKTTEFLKVIYDEYCELAEEKLQLIRDKFYEKKARQKAFWKSGSSKNYPVGSVKAQAWHNLQTCKECERNWKLTGETFCVNNPKQN